MGDVTRLAQCYRCRRIFPARPGERYCQDCRRVQVRERNRRRLLGVGGMGPSSAWAPIGTLAVLVVAGSFASSLLPGHAAAAAPWLGAVLGVWLVWRRTAGNG